MDASYDHVQYDADYDLPLDIDGNVDHEYTGRFAFGEQAPFFQAPSIGAPSTIDHCTSSPSLCASVRSPPFVPH